MARYPFTPELLDALPEELAELFRGLEDMLLDEICSRLTLKDQLNEVTVQAIRALRSHGIDTKDIEKAIQKTSGISEKKLNKLFDDVIARNQKYYTDVIDMAGVAHSPQTATCQLPNGARDSLIIADCAGLDLQSGRIERPLVRFGWAQHGPAFVHQKSHRSCDIVEFVECLRPNRGNHRRID